MFGYVTIFRKELDDAALDCYQGYYCGLCEALGRRYGVAGRMTLSYDMAFAAILLSALYEPEAVHSQGRCAPHPLRSKPRIANEFLSYAADMTIALAYYNFMDDWQDDRSRSSLHKAKTLEKYLPAIRSRWPRQCEAMEAQLAALNRLESSGSHDLDALCGAFGQLLGAVFACRDDVWRPFLEGVGRGLGGFIYLMDAYDDLKKDCRRGRYNALSELADALPGDAFETRCHELLTQQMGLCAQQFEMLPILQDTSEGKLLYNTIYAGVWCKYSLVKRLREGHKP